MQSALLRAIEMQSSQFLCGNEGKDRFFHGLFRYNYKFENMIPFVTLILFPNFKIKKKQA